MSLDDPPAQTPKLRLIGTVWGVVGLVAVVVGAVATVVAIVVFGVMAIVLGVALYVAQGARERSARETARTLAGDPVPPVSAPAPVRDDPPERRPYGGPDGSGGGGGGWVDPRSTRRPDRGRASGATTGAEDDDASDPDQDDASGLDQDDAPDPDEDPTGGGSSSGDDDTEDAADDGTDGTDDAPEAGGGSGDDAETDGPEVAGHEVEVPAPDTSVNSSPSDRDPGDVGAAEADDGTGDLPGGQGSR